MNREIMQQALDALDMACAKYGDVGNIHTDWGKWDAAGTALRDELAKQEFYPGWDMLRPYHERIKELEQQLAKPEQAIVPFPSFMRKRIEEAIDLAINPKGMSVHDGKATVYASDLQRMIAVIDLAPPRKEWVGLTQAEINRIISNLLENDTDPLMTLAYVIEAKLKEKNI